MKEEGDTVQESTGLYIHIPFCEKICHYCDFLTFVNQDHLIEKYVTYLVKEMALYKDKEFILDTIYFGGGTPSYLSASLIDQIMAGIRTNFIISSDCEISIEMNPESVTRDRIQTYIDNGFNRFTMGVQSFNNDTLKLMGRIHDKETVFDRIALLKQMGVENLGIDLMFANPRQGMDILKSDIDLAMTLDLQHISYYSLMIKEGTPFERWVQTRQIQLFEDEVERAMYHYIQETLLSHGFIQYEISNFAIPGSESRHNQKYWTLQDYLGIGLGAHSNLDLVRFSNYRRFDQYFDKIDQGNLPVAYTEKLSKDDREKEYIMLNTRLLKGFKISDINRKFDINFLNKYQSAIEKHLKLGTIHIEDDQFTFTGLGLDIGNQFYLDIL